MSTFKYRPLIGKFTAFSPLGGPKCPHKKKKKTTNNLSNNTHKHILRTLSQMEDADFEDLLQKDKSVTICKNNLQKLATEIL